MSDETLASVRAEITAWQELENIRKVADAQFMLGFCLLWRGALDEAEAYLYAALESVERTGRLTELARFLTYPIILYRKRGRVEEVRRLSRKNLAVANETGATIYAGTAHANLAWAAWRDGSLGEALAQGHAALDAWQGDFKYPFQWTALWPLLAVALMEEEFAWAIEHARALLAPDQQRLPEALVAVLEEAIQAADGGQPEVARASLERALELARDMRYL